MHREIPLIVSEEEGLVVLRSPDVGRFTHCQPADSLLSPGAYAGTLLALGETIDLVVPRGIAGRVVSERPERVRQPVGYGDVLYRLAPLDSLPQAAASGDADVDTSRALVFPAPYSGRFWQRPTPGDPTFLQPGDALIQGTTFGLIEVMKTFTHVGYGTGSNTRAGDLPEQAKLVRYLAQDGAEVTEGEALIEVK